MVLQTIAKQRKKRNQTYYQRHKLEQAARTRKYRQEHIEEQRKKAREWYQAVGKPREVIAKAKRKIEVLTHYGNGQLACVTCGESRIDCLSIDHIDGGGKSRRKEAGAYGQQFYKVLKRDNFPEGLQTLCMNCQFVKMVADRKRKREKGYE